MTSKKISLLISLLFFLSITACQQKDKEGADNQQRIINFTDVEPPSTSKDNAQEQYMMFEKKPDGSLDKTNTPLTKQIDYKQQAENFNSQDKRMIIRSGTMSIEADKFDESESNVKDIVKSFGGFVTNSTSSLNAANKKQGMITIRVTADKYDAMLSELSKIGKVMNQNISGKDVTEEFMDSEARVKTQRELESRLLKLLSEKTAKLVDVVEVEQKLAGVREQIEKTEGRMHYLKDQASYSTITVSIYEPSLLQTSTGGGFFHEMENAFKKGLKGFTSVISGTITFVIALSPILILFGVIGYFVKRYFKKRKFAQAQT